MSMRLAGRHALVTGSPKGIGLAIARAFVREGARVVITARHAADCAAVAKTLGDAAVPIAADLSNADEVRRLGAAALEALDGRVDVLVNNAGQPRVAPSAELAEADYRYTMDLNLTAYFLLAQAVVKGMLERRSGSIINVGSINGTVAFPQRLAYCVSKAGVNMLTKVLAIGWAASGRGGHCPAPGYGQTPFIPGPPPQGVLGQHKTARRT